MLTSTMENPLGLVLTGGGARGAYQAGVLKRIGEIQRIRTRGNPFPIITGSSAGAINGAMLAAGSDDFAPATDLLAGLWSRLRPSDVFRCDLFTQAHNSLTWIMDLSFGGLIGGGHIRSLLDAAPLGQFLGNHLRCERLQANIRQGHLYALAVSATSYDSGKSYLFIQGSKGHALWTKSRRVTMAAKITVEHICASAAIPVIFQPVRLKIGRTTALFGDGCVRLQQPLSPAIRLGADRILAIGVSGENLKPREENMEAQDLSLAQIMGVLFSAIFLDSLVPDNEHLQRLNQLLRAGHVSACRMPGHKPIRPLRSLLILPSIELSKIAVQHQKDLPYAIRYFVNSLGRDAASTSDLMSYLLFTAKYTNALLDLGYNDACKQIDEIEDLLYSPAPEPAGEEAGRLGDNDEQPFAEEIADAVEDSGGEGRPTGGAAAAARRTFVAVMAAIRTARARIKRNRPRVASSASPNGAAGPLDPDHAAEGAERAPHRTRH